MHARGRRQRGWLQLKATVTEHNTIQAKGRRKQAKRRKLADLEGMKEGRECSVSQSVGRWFCKN